MKKIAVIAVTLRGTKLMEEIHHFFPEAHYYTLGKWQDIKVMIPAEKIFYYQNLGSLIEEKYNKYQGFIMVTAMGIVFRVFAPHVSNKLSDPAVVVLDEKGNNAISALSGHLGGGNDLCRKLAVSLGANAVITTATDVNGVIAFDSIARKYNLEIEQTENLKKFNSAVLHNKTIKVFIDKALNIHSKFADLLVYDLDDYYRMDTQDELCCLVTNKDIRPMHTERLLTLRPKNIILGIGCRRGASATAIKDLVTEQLKQLNLSYKSIKAISTITLKKDEPGMIQTAKYFGVKINCFTEHEIENVCKDRDISSSEFVKAKVGVSCVCEPTAILGGKNVNLLLKKTAKKGVTLAIGEESWQ